MNVLRNACAPGGALHALIIYPQFIAHVFAPRRDNSGKLDKIPVRSTSSGSAFHAAAAENSMVDFETAAVTVERWAADGVARTLTDGEGPRPVTAYGVGFVFTKNDPFWFCDLDGALQPDGQWAPIATEIGVALVGSAIEVSSSGKGLHFIGSGTPPAHGCRGPHGLEFYSSGRFAALTGTRAVGSAAHDATTQLPAVIAKYFPPKNGSDAGHKLDWTTEAVWLASPPQNPGRYAELLAGDAAVLARHESMQKDDGSLDGSAADFNLACELLRIHGGNQQAVLERMMSGELPLHGKRSADESWLRLTVNNAFAEVSKNPPLDPAKVFASSGTALTAPPPPPSVSVGTSLTPPPSYVLDKKMQYPATIENLVYVLSAQQQAMLGFDQFRGRIMIAPASTKDWRPMSDTDMIRLRETFAREQRFAPISKDLMHDALQLVAERYSFDSAITWLNGLAWDGVPRVEEFLVTHCGAVDDDYARAVSLYIWSGLAARVLDPGCQLDMVVALQSPQGKQKSTGLQAMVPEAEWFTDGLTLHEDDDDFKRLIRGKLVVEIAEMAGLSKADINHLKRSITRRTEEWIEKWKTQPSRYERRCMLFATTNEEQFLPPDETGNRRWLPVEVAGLDRDRIAADRLQLWAEGAALWRQQRSITGKSGVLWAEAERLAAGLHQKYEATDLWEADIQRWLNTPPMFPPPSPPGQVPPPPAPAPCERPLALSEVLQGALKLEPARQDAKAEKRGGRVMRQLGYEKRDVKVDGKSVKRWMRVA